MHLCIIQRLLSGLLRLKKTESRWSWDGKPPGSFRPNGWYSDIEWIQGQNAVNGKLGMGEDKPKRATKPIQVETLLDLDIFQGAL